MVICLVIGVSVFFLWGPPALNRDLCGGDAACVTAQRARGAATAVTVGESPNARHFFTSHIYNDARLSVYGEHERMAELFVRQGADGRPRQLTFWKTAISGLAYDPVGGQVIFASATVKDDSFGFVPAINAPGKFSGFRFYRIDLADPNLAAAPLAIPPQIAVTAFGVTGAGDALVFGDANGQLRRFDFATQALTAHRLRGRGATTDGTEIITVVDVQGADDAVIFRSVDGYLMPAGGLYVHNLYRYALTTRETTMVTDHPFYTGLGDEEADDAARIERFRNSAVFFPGPKNRVRLSDGRGRYPLTPASGEGKIVVHHVLPLRWGDGRRELAVVFSNWSGGSGTFFSLAIFPDGAEVFTTRIFLGDRIGVDSLRRAALDRRQPADYRLAVTLRDRRSNQAFADKPTVLATRYFEVTDGQLLEVPAPPS